MLRIPVDIIGKLGELYAKEWLTNEGYEFMHFVALTSGLFEHTLQTIPRDRQENLDSNRTSKIQSLNSRIMNLRLKIVEAKNSPNIDKHQDWLSEQINEVLKMEKELKDIWAGKSFKTVNEEFEEELLKQGDTKEDIQKWKESVLEETKGKKEKRNKEIISNWNKEKTTGEKIRISFFGDKYKEFEKYVKAVYEINPNDNESTEPWELKKYRSSYCPDLIAKNGSKIYVIEVKANTSKLSKFQKKALEITSLYGFIPMILRVKFAINAEINVESI